MTKVSRYSRRTFLRASIASIGIGSAALCDAQYGEDDSTNLRNPVYRVANRPEPVADTQQHPLDTAINYAKNELVKYRSNVRDYTATVVKRERVNGTVGDYEYMFVKVRARKYQNNNVVSPLSVYMFFLKPSSIKGREVVFVEGQNQSKLCAHEGGLKGNLLPTVWLKPESMLAMRGQRYPITEFGIENLILKLIERGNRDRQDPDVEVEWRKGAKINGRGCTLLQVKHTIRKPEQDFYLAQIFIDDELHIPIRYAAYDWPETPESRPEVIEEYTYLNLKLNVGLADADFDPNNPSYNFYRKK
jgi:hypothetical protein